MSKCDAYFIEQTQHNKKQLNDTHHNVTGNKGSQLNNTRHNDTQIKDTMRNIQHNDTQRYETLYNIYEEHVLLVSNQIYC